jgi:hypothetical protein
METVAAPSQKACAMNTATYRALMFLFCALIIGVGCQAPRNSRTEDQFSFVQTALNIQTVTNRLGAPDRLMRHPIGVFMEYDLADGSHMLILPDDGTVFGMWHRHGTNWTCVWQKGFP